MAKMHHMALKAAVGKYLPMHTEGKNEAEVKAELALDEKKYDQEAIDEIYQAIVNFKEEGPEEKKPGKKNETAKKHIVVKSFRDRNNWNIEYNAGDDVSHFSKDRLEHLVKIKHVEEQ